MQTNLIAGFAQPVQDAQTVFRALLTALSEPAKWQTLPLQAALEGLYPATWASLQTVLDSDTKVYIAPDLANDTVCDNVVFHCACDVVDEPYQADFLVADVATAQTWDWRQLKRGTERSPEQSATLFLQLNEPSAEAMTVWQGSGMQCAQTVALNVDKTFWLQRAAATAFPLGVDVVFCHESSLLGLPRTTQVQFEGVATCM